MFFDPPLRGQTVLWFLSSVRSLEGLDVWTDRTTVA
ncbi:hypothetical protein Ae717Ps2_6927c [Pseudonocardia sp. Ae717_Ps2]|nr:hypothetical protein Ae717Ps2_7235c [Pseudonocardia sp. Ae717_Ps2]OLM27653.1 hypothetical protein Ae717Ps2_7264c [Pseudonocardia sp. Ae717_Ps2]OLM27663.1 hypothetical protein Ae717Ps2_7274c [Pseudonocardia sp. Ae717_Ps2]OLM27944.1 hypothetical protein Ae717Ps2_6911c [Pseudonocardia sp. Ae717_Ps2]OLM27960.1 hypothetical protein Ae717Ps2_6927c [Pseudonocardia sp. Ae717_Ps2]